jgi:hypothetical protein
LLFSAEYSERAMLPALVSSTLRVVASTAALPLLDWLPVNTWHEVESQMS